MRMIRSQLNSRHRIFCITNASYASPIEPNADDNDDDDDEGGIVIINIIIASSISLIEPGPIL